MLSLCENFCIDVTCQSTVCSTPYIGLASTCFVFPMVCIAPTTSVHISGNQKKKKNVHSVRIRFIADLQRATKCKPMSSLFFNIFCPFLLKSHKLSLHRGIHGRSRGWQKLPGPRWFKSAFLMSRAKAWHKWITHFNQANAFSFFHLFDYSRGS